MRPKCSDVIEHGFVMVAIGGLCVALAFGAQAKPLSPPVSEYVMYWSALGAAIYMVVGVSTIFAICWKKRHFDFWLVVPFGILLLAAVPVIAQAVTALATQGFDFTALESFVRAEYRLKGGSLWQIVCALSMGLYGLVGGVGLTVAFVAAQMGYGRTRPHPFADCFRRNQNCERGFIENSRDPEDRGSGECPQEHADVTGARARSRPGRRLWRIPPGRR